jgi:uncharacterized membrane protein
MLNQFRGPVQPGGQRAWRSRRREASAAAAPGLESQAGRDQVLLRFILNKKPMTRSALKTLTFAVLHFGVGFGVTYALTGSAMIATGVALIEPAVNTVVFFFHERVWAHLENGGERPLAQAGAPGV